MSRILLFISRISEIIELQPPLEQTRVEVMKGLHQRLSWSLSNNITLKSYFIKQINDISGSHNLNKLTTSQVTMSQKELNGIC